MPQGPGTYGSQRGRPPKKDNLMRNSVLKKAAKGRSYTPGAEEQMFTKPKLDPMLYDEEGKRRKKPLSHKEQQKIMNPTLGTKETIQRVPGSRTYFQYDEDKFGFPGRRAGWRKGPGGGD